MCVRSLPKDQDCHELWWKKYKKMQLKEQQEAGKGGAQAAGPRVAPRQAGADKTKPAADNKHLAKPAHGSVSAKAGAAPDKPGAVAPPGGKPKAEDEGAEEPPAEEVATVQAQLARLITAMQVKRSQSVEQIARSLNINVDTKMVALLDQFRSQMPQPGGAGEDGGQPEADLAFMDLGNSLAGAGQSADKHAGVKAALAHLLSQKGGGGGGGSPSAPLPSGPPPAHYVDTHGSGGAPPMPALLREPPSTSLGVPPSAAAQRPPRISDCAGDDAGPPSFHAGGGGRGFPGSDDSRSSISSMEDPSRGGGSHFYDRDRDMPVRRGIGISPGEYSERAHLAPDRQPLIAERPQLLRDYPDRGGTGGPTRGGGGGGGMGGVQDLGQDSFRRGGSVRDGYRGGVGMGGDGFESFHGGADSFHGMSGPGPDRRDGGHMYRGRGGEGRGGFQGGRGGYGW